MVEATKRKVDNPVYGHIPKATPGSRAGIEAARTAMRRKRRRNAIIGRVSGLLFLAAVVGGGYLIFRQYQADQNRPSVVETDDAVTGAGALSPIGEQVAIIEALDDVNSGVTPSAGGLLGAVEDAKAVVGRSGTETELGQPQLLVTEILPAEIVVRADALEPLEGYARYVIDVADAEAASPGVTSEWITRLQSLPSAPADSPGLSVLPAVQPGEMAIAVQTSGDTVTRIVAWGPDFGVRVDR
jgi:hypothetical protein